MVHFNTTGYRQLIYFDGFWCVKHKKHETFISNVFRSSQLTFTCSKLTTETLEKGVKYVQS